MRENTLVKGVFSYYRTSFGRNCVTTMEKHFFGAFFIERTFLFKEKIIMPDYRKMYHTLFNAMTDAITILQNAQIEMEGKYINETEQDDIKKMQFKIVEKDNNK